MRWFVFFDDPRDAGDFFNALSSQIVDKELSDNMVFFRSNLSKELIEKSAGRYGRIIDFGKLIPRDYMLIFDDEFTTINTYKYIIHVKNYIPTGTMSNPRSNYNPSLDNIRNVKLLESKILFKSNLTLPLIKRMFLEGPDGFYPNEILLVKQVSLKAKNNLTDLYNSGYMTDVNINVGDKQFKAHKLILGSSSEYFNKLFSDNSDLKEINIDDVDPDLFENFLKVIYGVDTEVESILDNLNIIVLAESFNLDIEDKDDKIFDIIDHIQQFRPELYDESMKLVDAIYPYGLPEELKNKISGLFEPKLQRMDPTGISQLSASKYIDPWLLRL